MDARTEPAVERAAVTFPAPHGIESIVLHDGDLVEFGRGVSCGIRFAFAPVIDEGVPRRAGRLVVAAHRVFVEVVDAPGRPSIQIAAPGRPTVMVAVGDGFSPAEPAFKLVVQGARQTWSIGVRVRRDETDTPPAADGTAPTRTYDIAFTDAQLRVLRAYREPLMRGRWEPATHREAAAALAYHPNSVREVLYDIWSQLFAAGVPLPDIADKRIAVVEAVRLHRLVPPGQQ